MTPVDRRTKFQFSVDYMEIVYFNLGNLMIAILIALVRSAIAAFLRVTMAES